MTKHSFTLDERGKHILRQTSTILYIITIYSLIGFQLYRQFVLNEPSEEWNDIALIISFNVIVWFGSLLYLSGVVNPKYYSDSLSPSLNTQFC
jgi:glycopeptide antibiotics resistance protein